MKKRITGGATLWARQTIESEVFYLKPDKWFKIWFFIVNQVNYTDFGQFHRGQGFMTYEQISLKTRSTRDQVDKFLRWAKQQEMATTQKTTRGMVVTVLNYAKYQDIKTYKSDTESEVKAKQKRHRSDTINNKGNKGNKGKEYITSPKGEEGACAPSIPQKERIKLLPEEPLMKNQDIDRTFPRTRLYGDEGFNWLLDYAEWKWGFKLGGHERWNRIACNHIKKKIGLGKARDLVDWLAEEDCWWRGKVRDFMSLYKKLDMIQASKEQKAKKETYLVIE